MGGMKPDHKGMYALHSSTYKTYNISILHLHIFCIHIIPLPTYQNSYTNRSPVMC